MIASYMTSLSYMKRHAAMFSYVSRFVSFFYFIAAVLSSRKLVQRAWFARRTNTDFFEKFMDSSWLSVCASMAINASFILSSSMPSSSTVLLYSIDSTTYELNFESNLT